MTRRRLLRRGRERRPVGQIAEGEEALVRHECRRAPREEQQPAARRAARLVVGGTLQTGKEEDREDEGDGGNAPQHDGPVVFDLTGESRGGRKCEEQPQGDQQNSEDGGPDQTKSPPRSGHTLPRRPPPPAPHPLAPSPIPSRPPGEGETVKALDHPTDWLDRSDPSDLESPLSRLGGRGWERGRG